MQKIKVKYKKGEEVKFISHRDLMRAFQRAIRRADLPVAYSQGFNPHMKISWGNALKVGAVSDGEFAEIQFELWVKPPELKDRLNRHLPKGLEILEAFLV
ncbi:MAG: TIGR03936 family radical SAM-associated protein [Candidatus Margulisbacteria bacterium]|nr:TIGR03936 family radical SAM-associated protein [Candidatus Margulisiibacteriota bacterium]